MTGADEAINSERTAPDSSLPIAGERLGVRGGVADSPLIRPSAAFSCKREKALTALATRSLINNHPPRTGCGRHRASARCGRAAP